jgi:hypothetical protein
MPLLVRGKGMDVNLRIFGSSHHTAQLFFSFIEILGNPELYYN